MEGAREATPEAQVEAPTDTGRFPLPRLLTHGTGAVLGAFVLSRLLLMALSGVVALARRQTPISVWNQWDSKWYLGIAAHGYQWGIHGKPALAFFPLYPLMVHAFTRPGLSSEVVALVLSNAAFAGALFYLYRLTRSEWGDEAAGRAVWLIALFPTAFFTFAPYSESLFLLCAIATLYYGHEGRFALAGICLALALLTRSTALILLPAMLVVLRPRGLRCWLPALAPSVCAIGAYALYLTTHHLSLIHLLDSQRAWHRALTYPWTGFTASVAWLARYGASNLAWSAENLLQLGVTVLFVVLTLMAWRHMGRTFAIYCAGFWALVLSSPQWLDHYYAPFSSMDRFVLALFPLAGWAAARLSGHHYRLLLAASGALMLGSAAVHLVGGWVG